MTQVQAQTGYNELVEEQRQALRDAFRSNSSDKDKVVVTIAGAALGLSIAFLSNVEPDAGWKWMLVLALSAFGAAVVAVLLSFQFNSAQIERSIVFIDDWKQGGSRGQPRDGVYVVTVGSRRFRVTNLLNTFSVFAVIAGVVLIVVFVSANL